MSEPESELDRTSFKLNQNETANGENEDYSNEHHKNKEKKSKKKKSDSHGSKKSREQENCEIGENATERKTPYLVRTATLLDAEVEPDASWQTVLIVVLHKLSWFFAWILCTGWMLKFGGDIGKQYETGDPVTVTTFVDREDFSRPSIKICNNVFLDPKKVLEYKDDVIPEESYKFIREAINRNDFNDSGFVFDTPVLNLLLMSSRTANAFRLDMGQFMIACGDGPRYSNCSEEFQWVLEDFRGCYKTRFKTMEQVGAFNSFSVLLYLDPEVNLGKYTAALGAEIIIGHHSEDKFSKSDGISLAPNEYLTISAHNVITEQERSLEKSSCTNKNGLQAYNFTGDEFEVTYSTVSCRSMCTAQLYYSMCNCSPIWGMNITYSECLEDQEKRECISRVYRNDVRVDSEMPTLVKCLDGCIRKCFSRDYDLQISRATSSPTPDYLVKELKNVLDSGTEDELAKRLLEKLESGEISAKEMAKNVAQLNVYLKEENLVKKIKISPLLTFPTFLSNIGGLVGMWLGLSVISLLHTAEKMLRWSEKKLEMMYKKKTTAKKMEEDANEIEGFSGI